MVVLTTMRGHYSKQCIWGKTKPNIYVTVRKNRRKVTKVTGEINTINFTESSNPCSGTQQWVTGNSSKNKKDERGLTACGCYVKWTWWGSKVIVTIFFIYFFSLIFFRYIGTGQNDEPGTCDNTFSPPNKYIKTHNKVFNISKKSNKCSNGDCPETTRKWRYSWIRRDCKDSEVNRRSCWNRWESNTCTSDPRALSPTVVPPRGRRWVLRLKLLKMWTTGLLETCNIFVIK